MKKTIFTLLLTAIFGMSMAQDLKTYSVYDTNQSGDLNIVDVTEVVDKVKANVAASSTQQYVTGEQLLELFNAINEKLDRLESANKSLRESNYNMEEKLGIPHTEGGHEYVDLGLSVKWATMNVGATEVAGTKKNSHTGKLDCYGEYYAWGETSPKDNYDLSTYTLCNGSHTTMTKYCKSSSYGTVDNKITLELSDDAARANWGGSWRMPTEAEQTELRKNCYWEWTNSYNNTGVIGYIVYKVKNAADKGKWNNTGSFSQTPTASYSLSDIHIFLPAAGYREDTNFSEVGSYGHCWSSLLDEDYPFGACNLYFYSEYVDLGHKYRYTGRSVRAVCP